MYFVSKDPNAGHNYGVISILFNRTNYTESNHTTESKPIINSFFESLELVNLNDFEKLEDVPLSKIVEEVKLGDLLNVVNMRRRWIYQGTTTMPPCQSITYWNVLSTIYPISEHHYQILKS